MRLFATYIYIYLESRTVDFNGAGGSVYWDHFIDICMSGAGSVAFNYASLDPVKWTRQGQG